jgi:hypothetical protein
VTQPTINQIQAVDPVLTNMLISYMQSDDRFVADRVFAPVPVDFISHLYYKLTKKYWFSDEAKNRAPGGSVPRGGYGVETDTFTTIQYALGHTIPRENRANNQVPLNLERAGVRWLAGQHKIRRERMFAAAAMTTGKWATDNTTATDWDDSTSDPVADIKLARRTISQSTGFSPSCMCMGEIVADALEVHPDVIDRIKYTQAATAASIRAAMSALFELEIIVGKAIYNSANESQDAVMVPIIDDDCLICYSEPGTSLEMPSAGKTLYWAPGGGLGTIEPLWFDNQTKSDVIDSFQQVVHKVTASDLGYFFSDIV